MISMTGIFSLYIETGKKYYLVKFKEIICKICKIVIKDNT